MAKIPKVIHQTWKTGEVPEEWLRYQRSWQELHPGWEYRLWTDADNRAFIAERAPEFLPTFDGYPYGILRADAIRYFLLYHLGGLYVDLDVEALAPANSLVEGRSFVTCREPDVHAASHFTSTVVTNALMASAPGHAYMKAVMDELAKAGNAALTHRDVLTTTGPLMMARVFDQLGEAARSEVTVLDAHVFSPHPNRSAELKALEARTGNHEELREECLKNGTIAIHYWSNSWANSLAGELNNPDPEAVEGYDFYPGRDSPGFDLNNGGRDVPALADLASADPAAMGFNTDGFIKSRIRPSWQWESIGLGAEGEGLYVKREYGTLWSRWIMPWLKVKVARIRGLFASSESAGGEAER